VKYDDETLMAYADGELDAAQRAQIDAAIAQDPGLALRVQEHKALRARMTGAFSRVLDQPIPERLEAAARVGVRAETPARGNVIKFPARSARAPSPPWRAREWIAMAASLLLGVLLSWRLLVPANSAIKSFEELRGKRVGVVEFSFQDIQFIYACKRKGIDAFKDLTRVNLSSPAGVVAGMTSARVDACTIFEPYGSILMIEHGAKMISNLGDDSFGISNGGLYVHNDFIRKYPELTQDIVDATVKATDFVTKDKGAWIARAQQFTGQTEAVAKLAIDNCTPSLDIPIDTIRKISTAMYDAGIHNRDVADVIDKFIDYRFLEKSTGKTKEQLGFKS